MENPVKYYEQEILKLEEENRNRLVHECLGVILCDENGTPRFADGDEGLKCVVWGAKIGIGKNRALKRAEKELSRYVADTIFNNYSEAVLTNDIQAMRLTSETYDCVQKVVGNDQKLAMAYLRYILCWAASDGTIEEKVEQKLADMFKENMAADLKSRGIKFALKPQINFANMPEKQREREAEEIRNRAKKEAEKREKEKEKREKEKAEKEETIKKQEEKLRAKLAEDRQKVFDKMAMVREAYAETIKLLDARYQPSYARNQSETENANAMLAQLEKEHDNLGVFNLARRIQLSKEIDKYREMLSNLEAQKRWLDSNYNTQKDAAARKQQDDLTRLQSESLELYSKTPEEIHRMVVNSVNAQYMALKSQYMIPKAKRWADIKAYIMSKDIPNGSSLRNLLAFIDKELCLEANKKNRRRQTAMQIENEGYKKLIVEYLGEHDEATCTEMIQNIPSIREAMLTNQRVTAICRLMVDEGTITKAVIKGQVVFTLVK